MIQQDKELFNQTTWRKYREVAPEKLTYNKPANTAGNILSNIFWIEKD